MCLGVSTPIVRSNTEFSWFLNGEVMKYSSDDELCSLLIDVFEGGEIACTMSKKARKYTIEFSPERIAREFMGLFEKFLRWEMG